MSFGMGTNGRMEVKLTNVAVVRMKKGSLRFEVAAYKNKVMNWRSRVETDIQEVLQVPSVFTNVSRGIHAKASDLMEAFGTEDKLKCAMMILDKGEMEMGELERQSQYEGLFRDIATTVAEKCVNPATRRPYPVSFIEKALHDVHFAVVPTKSAKQQSLKAIAALKAILAIERAKMQLRLTVPARDGAEVRAWLDKMDSDMVTGESSIVGGEEASLELLVDPGLYRAIEEGMKSREGTVEVLSLSVSAGGEGGVGGSSSSSSSSSGRPGGGVGVDAGKEEGGGGGSSSGSANNSSSSSSSGGGGGGGGYNEAEAASSRGTGMLVRRVVLPGRRLACNACDVQLDTPEEHKEHHRSEWHRVNLKRKVKGVEGFTREVFEGLSKAEVQALLDQDL